MSGPIDRNRIKIDIVFPSICRPEYFFCINIGTREKWSMQMKIFAVSTFSDQLVSSVQFPFYNIVIVRFFLLRCTRMHGDVVVEMQ